MMCPQVLSASYASMPAVGMAPMPPLAQACVSSYSPASAHVPMAEARVATGAPGDSSPAPDPD